MACTAVHALVAAEPPPHLQHGGACGGVMEYGDRVSGARTAAHTLVAAEPPPFTCSAVVHAVGCAGGGNWSEGLTQPSAGAREEEKEHACAGGGSSSEELTQLWTHVRTCEEEERSRARGRLDLEVAFCAHTRVCELW